MYCFSLKSLLLWRNNFKPYFLINRQKNEAEYMFLLDALGD